MDRPDPSRYDVQNKKVAILATHGFEPSELHEPLQALKRAGADPTIVSLPESDEEIHGFDGKKWKDEVEVDATLPTVSASNFDALVLPGGVMNPDRLRSFASAVSFVKDFFEDGKPVAAICHAPWLLAEADVAEGRRITSWHSIRTDLENAGADWVDEEVVVDQGLVTSRSPEDLPAFLDKMLEEIAEGRHAGQHA